MERIASFSVDHTTLKKGMYISRVDFGDIVTYDIRMKEPNGGDYLSIEALHTFEHLFATYARNSEHGSTVVYVGPMGCRTGCYLLTKGLSHENAIQMVRNAFAFVRDFEGDIPGASEPECGNWREHNLQGAKKDAEDMLNVLQNWDVEHLNYDT